MLSKGSVVVLPVLLLGIVWWLRPSAIAGPCAVRARFLPVAVVLAGSELVVPNSRFRRR